MVAALACALLSPVRLSAQKIDPRAAGTTFVLGFTDTTKNAYDTRQDTDPRFTPREPRQDSIFISIYSAAENDVVITGNGGYSKTMKMGPGSFEVVFLNGNPRAPTPIVTESGIVSNKTFRIEATQPIVVYCFMVTKFGTEAWTPIPVESWGTEYYAAALPGEVLYDEIPAGENNYGKQPIAGPAEILIMAAFDNTSVTIVPNARLDKNPPTTVVLKKDQCYQVQSYVDTNSFNLGVPQPDLGGSYIYASKPIGVISGNTRSQVLDQSGGLAKNSFKNMMMEWLAPVEQHGTEFVYLATNDDLKPTGAPGENPDWKRQGEIVRVYGTAGAIDDETPTETEGVAIEGLAGATVKTFKIERSKFFEMLIGAPTPHVFKTDRPAQAYMNSSAVVKFNGTTGGGTFVGSSYESWAPYAVEMTPREQWTWVAPFYAPIHPPKMAHYLNIVTDEKSRNKIKVGGSQMVINRQIAGTDLWWGTKTLNRGDKGLIEGADSSAKFYAFVYGNMKGFETYRPGRTKKEGDGSGSAGNRDRRDGKDQVVHPSEYEENIGFLYGYPVAPSRLVLRPSDSLLIDTLSDCGTLTVKVRTLNPKPVGLRAISLDSVKNARLTFVDPAPPEPVIGLTKAEVKVSPIDPRKDASGVVVIQDRTGKTWRVPYKYIAEYVNINPSDILNFGEVTVNSKQTKTVTITNPLSKPVSVDTLLLALGTQSFTIVSTKPAISTDPKNRTIIGPGDSLVIEIEVFPTIQNKLYEDSLKVKFGCTQVALPLRAETVQACLFVNDLDFGILAPGQSKSLPLRICNNGRGFIIFHDPWLTWLKTEFSVSTADMDKLKAAKLGPNECIDITVTFVSNSTGAFRDPAKFWSNTSDGCRDVSVWTAIVTKPGPFISSYDWQDRWLTTLDPCTKSNTGEYVWDVYAYNSGDRDFIVSEVKLVGDDADKGYFRLDNDTPATTIAKGDRMVAGDTTNLRRLQRVIFKPEDTRLYNCEILLITEGTPPDTVRGFLQGRGIESYITIGDKAFGRFEFTPTAPVQVAGSVTLTAPNSSRSPVTITSIRLSNPVDFSIVDIRRADNTVINTPFPIAKDEIVTVNLQFNPQASSPADKTSDIIVEGDFSRCDGTDSVGVLTGDVFTVGAGTIGNAIPTITTCDDDQSFVTVYNTGSTPIEIRNAVVTNSVGGVFEVPSTFTFPVTLAGVGTPGDSLRIPVTFDPNGTGQGTGTVSFDAYKQDAAGNWVKIDINPADVTSNVVNATVSVRIDRNYRSYPGTMLTIPMILEGGSTAAGVRDPGQDANFEMAKVTRLKISMTYDPGMMLLDNGQNQSSLLAGTALAGWQFAGGQLPKETPGSFEATFETTNPNDFLKAPFPSTLLNFRFKTFLGSVDSSEINYSVIPDGKTECVTVVQKYGLAKIDSVCGLNFRLIERVAGKYALPQTKPNPVTGAMANIEFSLGLDGPTTLVVYNAQGDKVGTLVDQYLQPGTYTVTWDAGAQPSGLYYYRLTSSAWSQTNTMILQK